MTETVLTFMVTSPSTPRGQFGDNILEPWIDARPDAKHWGRRPHATHVPTERGQYRDYVPPTPLALIELYDFILAGPPTEDDRHDYQEGLKRFRRSLGDPNWKAATASWSPVERRG